MSRQKTVFKFSRQGIEQLRQYANILKTQERMKEMFKNPELEELIENEDIIAAMVVQAIIKDFKIVGKPDMDYINSQYEYYTARDKTHNINIL